MSTLDNLKREAKRWLKALRAGDAAARARLARAYPAAPAEPALRDVQHALARENDAESWSALKGRLAREPHSEAETPLRLLLHAADRGDVPALIAVADRHPDLVSARGTLPGHTGLRTALHFGVHHRDVVAALLDRGADPNIRDEGDNAMPLHFACERNDLDTIRLLIEHGADPIGTGDGHDLDIIGWACVFGNARPDIVDYLLAHGSRHNILSAVATGAVAAIDPIVVADPAQLDRTMDRTNLRRRPVHLAIVKRQQDALAALIRLGADIDAVDAAGLTALDQAALDGQTAMAALLVDSGATIQLPAAIVLNRTDDIERLLRESPDALRPGGAWARVIIRASEKGSAETIEMLIRHGASVDARDDTGTSIDGTSGYTALHAAAWNGNLEAVDALLRHGASPCVRDGKYCATPAGWADYAGHPGVRDAILRGPIDLFDAIHFNRPDLIPGILARDPAALARPFAEYADCGGEDEGDPRPTTTPLEWAVIRNNVEAAQLLASFAAQRSANPELVARFLRSACWDHHVHGKGDHEMYARAAQRMLLQHPEIARASIYTAVVCGDADEVDRILRARPEAANEPGGERGWPPLLYLCFARIPHQPTIDNAVRIATTLLDHGADPNTFYMAGSSHYTALVGVAGEGEQDSPRQPQAAALFALLLERGARPFDIQVLYNTHFSGEVRWWLELVYQHTVRTGQSDVWKDPNWPMLDMGGYGPAPYFLLRVALEHDDLELAEWVLSRGGSPNATSTHRKFAPRLTLYQEAVAEGKRALADLLARHGAVQDPPAADRESRFLAACMTMNRDEVTRMAAAHPELLQSPRAIFAAAHRGRADVVGWLLDLGVPLEIEESNGQRLLHEAAAENAVDVARLLIDRGAEIDRREPTWNATPFGFAAHGQRRAMMDLLSTVTRDVWGLAFNGYTSRLREIFGEQPDLARAVDGDGQTLLWYLPADEARALELVDMLLSHGADAAHRSNSGSTAFDWARTCAMTKVAERLTVPAES